MRRLLCVVAAMWAAQSSAEVIKCFFTEPFVVSEYNLKSSNLVYTGMDGKSETYQNVSFHIKGAGDFYLQAQDGHVMQELKLNFKGSDGMSDFVYPYDVKDNTDLTQPGYGGCESSQLKRKE